MYGEKVQLDNPAYIHPTALIYGEVKVSEDASLWPYVVIRGDTNEVVIGKKTNIQDFVMIHVGLHSGTQIGENCSITHHCTLHGCRIGDNCLIGINATIMDGCVIGNNCIVAGHTFLKEGTIIPDNSIVAGIPGKVIKERDCSIENKINAFGYYENALGFANGDCHRLKDPDVLSRLGELIAGMS